MILHIDMDAFYASVEIRDDEKLVGRPVIVGGSATGRGVVCAASYEARKFGVHSAMPGSQAARLCPNAVFIKPRMSHYAAVSRQIRDIFSRFTSLVEPLSLDEAFLDVGGSERLFGDAVTIAQSIKQAIRDELNLPCSAGVAPNKFLAKVASDLDKPDGLTVVPVDGIDAFLDPLAISRVWGVGPKTEARLNALGIRTVGQLRRLSKSELGHAFGANGDHFWRLARGLDTRPVVPDRFAKSISHESTFANDIHDPSALRAWLRELTDQVGRRLRRHEIVGRTVTLKLRYYDFRTISRSSTMSQPSAVSECLWQEVSPLLDRALSECCSPVRLLGMGVSQLRRPGKVQRGLFDVEENERNKQLDQTLDSIRDRLGKAAVKRASSVEHSIRFLNGPMINPEDQT
jgi:DNA polymerase-4